MRDDDTPRAFDMQELLAMRWDEDLQDMQKQQVRQLLKNPGVEASPELLEEARRLVVKRFKSVWTGLNVRPEQRRKYVNASAPPGRMQLLETAKVELLIMQLLAFTSPARQFAVSAVGAVFAASTNGLSKESERLYVSGLSPLIDDVGQFVFDYRAEVDKGIGGRFYESGGFILDAVTKKPLLLVMAVD